MSLQSHLLCSLDPRSDGCLLQRFEQKSTMRKHDAAIRFPSVLNMKPYTKYAMDDTDG